MKRKIITLLLLAVAMTMSAQNIQGAWNGELKVGTAKLRLVLNIAADGKCTMDSPDQNAKGIPAELEFVSADSLSVVVPVVGARYDGKLKNGALEGVFRQSGQSFPLMLKPGSVALNRPQTPQPPFDYHTEEVFFTNTADNATLCGTLTYPVGFDKGTKKKVPVVLMVTGSGLQNRDEEVFGHKPFAVIADWLAKHGIASLRYDDRSVGKSTGDAKNATTYNNYLDAVAGLDYLKSLKTFGKTGVLGHSEGGTIAFMAAARQPKKVDFIVSLAGGAVRGDSILAEQNYVMLRWSGFSDTVAKDYGKALAEVLRCKAEGSTPNMAQTGASLPESLRKNLAVVMSTPNPWLDYFSQFDPSEDIARIKCPVLAVNGKLDMQVLPASNLGNLRRLLPHNKKTVIKEYEGLNHLLQHCTLGTVAEYNQIEETISEEILSDVAEWVNEVTK